MDFEALSSAGEVQEVRLCLTGFGNVAQKFCEIAADRDDELSDQHGIRVLFTAIATTSHGVFTDPVGLSARQVLDRYLEAGNNFSGDQVAVKDLIAGSGADVLVESTPLEHGAATATAHLEAAFDAGLDVITVNKGPIAWRYQHISTYARERGRRLRFEGVTMDGCPVYNLAEFCLPGDRVLSFRGVLNSTTNYVLDAMAEGANLDEAIADARSEGITETDPSYDIDGHDAAAKVAALSNVLLGVDITPDDVQRESIQGLGPDDIARVSYYGRRMRVVCSANRQDGGRTAKATLEQVRSDDALFGISGTSSALILETELAGKVEITERNGKLGQTAYAVYADLLTLFGR
ncbi:MAG: homoserine dehydrogenase [Candidatus Nanopelagicales bacterium]